MVICILGLPIIHNNASNIIMKNAGLNLQKEIQPLKLYFLKNTKRFQKLANEKFKSRSGGEKRKKC